MPMISEEALTTYKLIAEQYNELCNEKNIPRKYVQRKGKGPIYLLLGSSSIAAYEDIEEKLNKLEESINENSNRKS